MAEQQKRQRGGKRPPQRNNNHKQNNSDQKILPTNQSQDSIRVVILGGLGEVGRNMMAIEFKGKILIVDMGFRMPEDDMPGVDYIIPNIDYLKNKAKDVVGVLITHGHYDHIGAIPYFMKKIGNPPMFAGAMAKGIIMKRQAEFPNQPRLKMTNIQDGKKFRLGPFEVEPFMQNHTIADNFGFVIRTDIGSIIHTSDFKFDEHPVNEPPSNYEKLKSFGKEKPLLLLADSTNAEQPGHSLSEQTIYENLEEIFKRTEGRIITATFSSLLNRVQQIITLSEKHGRRVIVEGHSLKVNVEIAKKLGYIKAKPGTFIKPQDVGKYPENKITVMGTGTQGEERAMLMRIVTGEHRHIKLTKGDTVIFSSSVIPGNERTVQFVKDELYRKGVKVFHYRMMDIHASGHANEDELKLFMQLTKPKFMVPIHGQISMMVRNKELADEVGIPESNSMVIENGNIINVSKDSLTKEKATAPSSYVMVDGLGVGDVGEIVLRDRQNLAAEGMFVIIAVVDRQTGKLKGSPDIISRGFVYLREAQGILKETRKLATEVINESAGSGGAVNWVYVRDNVRNKIGELLFHRTQRRPMILPVIIEV